MITKKNNSMLRQYMYLCKNLIHFIYSQRKIAIVSDINCSPFLKYTIFLLSKYYGYILLKFFPSHKWWKRNTHGEIGKIRPAAKTSSTKEVLQATGFGGRRVHEHTHDTATCSHTRRLTLDSIPQAIMKTRLWSQNVKSQPLYTSSGVRDLFSK